MQQSSFESLIRSVASIEGDMQVEMAGSDVKPSGSVTIDLGDFDEGDVGLDLILKAVSQRGTLSNRVSVEGGSQHNPALVRVMDVDERTDGADNLVVNGEYIPDVIGSMVKDTTVKVISPHSSVRRDDKDTTVFYVINDEEDDRIYRHLKSQKFFVAKTPMELGDVLEAFRNR